MKFYEPFSDHELTLFRLLPFSVSVPNPRRQNLRKHDPLVQQTAKECIGVPHISAIFLKSLNKSVCLCMFYYVHSLGCDST